MSIEAKNDWQASETEEANNCELVSLVWELCLASRQLSQKNSRSVGNNNNNLSGWLAVATRTESTWEANPREARVGEQQSDMQSTVRGQRRRRLRYAAAAGTRTAACGLQCCCWGCIEGLSIAAAPTPRRPPPPTFEASKEPTITASRNFLSRLPLHSKLQAYTNSGGGSAISRRRRRNAAACLQAQ